MREFKSTDVLISFQSGQFSSLSHDWDKKNILVPTSSFYFITEGEIQVKFNNSVFDVKENDLLLIPSGALHDSKVADHLTNAKLLWFHFNIAINDKSFTHVFNLPHKVKVKDPEKCKNLFYELFKYAEKHNAYNSLKVSSCINNITLFYLDHFKNIKENENNGYMHQIVNYIEKNYNCNITIEDLAKKAHLSPTYFIKKFREYTGFSPLHYLHHTRMEQARYLLGQTNLPINSIMEQVGYFDFSYFTKYFKKYYGMTPSNYRKPFMSELKNKPAKKTRKKKQV